MGSKSEWQPIETAPKDRRILIIEETGEISAACHWESEGWFIPRDDDQRCYESCYGGECEVALLYPLFWMDLPAAPSQMVKEDSKKVAKEEYIPSFFEQNAIFGDGTDTDPYAP